MANEQMAEIKQEIVIRHFEEEIPSRHTGTFELFYFKCENTPGDFGVIVELYPNGISHTNEGYVSVKISTTLSCSAEMHCNLSVVDSEGNHLLLQSESCVNSHVRMNCILERFLKHDTLLAQKDKLLPGDVLSINCEIQCRYDVDFNSSDHLWYRCLSLTETFNEERDKLTFDVTDNLPQDRNLSEVTIETIRYTVTRDSDKRSVSIDDTDHRTLFELMLYLSSNSSFRPTEDTYTIHDSDYDRDTSDCVKYAIDIDELSKHAPGLLGLSYMHKQHQLRCTVKHLIRHVVFQLAKDLRGIITVSKMKTNIDSIEEAEEGATPDLKSTKRSMEFLAILRRTRLEYWHELADVLKLYIAADKCHVEEAKEYCRKYFINQLFTPIAIFVAMLADDYHDANLKSTIAKIIRKRESDIMKLPTWDILTRSQPDLVKEIFAASDDLDDTPENASGGEELLANLELFAALKVSDDTPETAEGGGIPKIYTAPSDTAENTDGGEGTSKDVKI